MHQRYLGLHGLPTGSKDEVTLTSIFVATFALNGRAVLF